MERWLVLGGAAAIFAGCVGNIGGDAGSDEVGGPDATPQCADGVGVTRVRMLNGREYGNTVRDLLGVSDTPEHSFPADPIVHFDNVAESLVASAALVDQQMRAAESLSLSADVMALTACGALDESGCIDAFIERFGRRAYRRPLDADEMAVLAGIFDDARARGRDFADSARLVIQTALQSPQFLYRIETTLGDDAEPVPVSPYELASRLSYFLWASMPDEALLDRAEAGDLSDPAVIEAEVRRMLDDARAEAMTDAFHALWLSLGRLDVTTKESDVHADFASIAPDMRKESIDFTAWAFWQGGGARSYLLSDQSFASPNLSSHYGDGERVGLLTLGSFLSFTGNPDRTSPTRRGAFIREQVLCQPPPPPPENVDQIQNDPGAGSTFREQLAEHASNPACSGCHQLIDPPGFGLEHYDTVGRYRELDNGAPVDASGELLSVSSEGPFEGARQLSERIADSEEYYACYATQWFRFATGRVESAGDACVLEALEASFRAAGDDPLELLVAIALSDAFRFKVMEAE